MPWWKTSLVATAIVLGLLVSMYGYNAISTISTMQSKYKSKQSSEFKLTSFPFTAHCAQEHGHLTIDFNLEWPLYHLDCVEKVKTTTTPSKDYTENIIKFCSDYCRSEVDPVENYKCIVNCKERTMSTTPMGA